MRRAGALLLGGAFLTAWAGIWWVHSEPDFARYFLQAVLFAVVGLVLFTEGK